MALFENFPYTNFHDMNLDWILKKFVEMDNEIKTFVHVNRIKYANPLQWNITTQYEANTVVLDSSGTAYLSAQPVPAGVSLDNTDYWIEISNFSELWDDIKHAIDQDDQNHSWNASRNYRQGEYLWIENDLYKTLEAVSRGTTFIVDQVGNPGNVRKVHVMEQIFSINSDISNLTSGQEEISQDFEQLTENVNQAISDLNDSLADGLTEIQEEIGLKMNSVFIRDIRSEYPDYTDDQLMTEALNRADSMGTYPKVVWDYNTANFSGDITFAINRTSGIDFSGQTVNMPAKNGTLFRLIPEDSRDQNIVSTSLGDYSTDASDLFNKFFAINMSTSGATAMCAGDRLDGNGEQIYVCQGMVTDIKGQYTNTKVFFIPSVETAIPVHNIHTIPSFTTEICNAHIAYPASSNMMLFLTARRSKTHVHHITVSGYVNSTTYKTGVISFAQCAYIEVDHIYGGNPIQVDLTSGYLLSLFDGCSDIYLHDCDMHDTIHPSWGALGMNCISNAVIERVNTQRVDCHYFSWGYFSVKDCNLDYLQWSSGVCDWTVENVNFTRRLPNFYYIMTLRSDSPSRLRGTITIKNIHVRIDTSYGAEVNATRLLNNSLWGHGTDSHNNVPDLLSNTTNIVLQDSIVENVSIVMETGDMTEDYAQSDVYISNCSFNLSSYENSVLLYDRVTTGRCSVYRLYVNNCKIYIQRLIQAAIRRLFINSCQFSPSYPLYIDRGQNIARVGIISNSEFGGLTNQSQKQFDRLLITGCFVNSSSDTFNTSYALNYMLVGNYSSGSLVATWLWTNTEGFLPE